MHCGVCGTPIPEGRAHCLYCGATVKYALTEQGTLPYEQMSAPLQPSEPDKAPAPRWDLEGPEGNAHSRWLAMRDTYNRWAALERRRRVSKSALGCFFTGTLLILLFTSCGILSFMESQEEQHTQAQAQAQQLSASEMTATAITDPNPYPPYQGLIKLNDALTDSTGSGGWMDYTSDPTNTNQGCAFQNNTYVATQPQENTPEVTPCLAYNTDFQNFAYQITMVNSGQGSSGGIVFRQCAPGAFYYFYIAPDGSYGLWINTGKYGKALAEGYSKAIDAGVSSNILGVVASGSTLDLYINHQHLTTVSDATYSWGRIGTAVRTPDRTEATERTFNNAQVWAF